MMNCGTLNGTRKLLRRATTQVDFLSKARTRIMMITTTFQLKDDATSVVDQPHARTGLALMRLAIGTMFVWVFFENLGKGLYTPTGYANLIRDYIENGSAPAAWKSVMALAAAHASMAAPLQAITEISLGVLLVLGLFTRPAALVAFAFLTSLWVSEWGTAWIWELLVPMIASLALVVGAAGRTWGVDTFLSRKRPSSLWW
jgi:uncharacterized membrane protein YphA (DoxX/SURF4 family)